MSINYKGRELLSANSCGDGELIAEFLNTSRKASDDNIKNMLGQASCAEVVATVGNEWARRKQVLDFCKNVAAGNNSNSNTKPSNADPQQIASAASTNISALSEHARDPISFPQTGTDPRLDAYTARDEIQKNRNGPTSMNFAWISTENITEDIIRDSTTQIVRDRCGYNF